MLTLTQDHPYKLYCETQSLRGLGIIFVLVLSDISVPSIVARGISPGPAC